MGVPKRKMSHARQGDRRAHLALTTPQLEACPHCKDQKRAHHACPTCGWYGGREAVRVKSQRSPEASA